MVAGVTYISCSHSIEPLVHPTAATIMEDVNAAPKTPAPRTPAPETAAPRKRIGIIGSGPIAAAVSHALLRQELAHEVIAVPVPGGDLSEGPSKLIRTHTPTGATSLHAGEIENLSGTQAVVLALEESEGAPAVSIERIMKELDRVAPDAVVIVACEATGCATARVLGASARSDTRIFGLGTCEETADLRRRVSSHYDVSDASVYALVVGGRGKAAVPVWSHVLIGGHPIIRGQVNGRTFDREAMWDAFYRSCDHATAPIEDGRKRDTFERCVGDCVRAVLEDTRAVLPVSTLVDGPFDVRKACLALPCIIGKDGIHGRVLPDLSPDEEDAFRQSANAGSMLAADVV